MKYIIIGLGNFGTVLAEQFTDMGHEVIGADISDSKVENIKDKIATAFVLDASDSHALDVLPLAGVDAVVVAIGENFGASIRVVALLKEKKVKRIFARASDEVHKAILQAFNIERILSPEAYAARDLVNQLEFAPTIQSFKVDDNYYVAMFQVPERMIDYAVNELKLDEEFQLKIIGIKQQGTLVNCVGFSILEKEIANGLTVDYKIQKEDVLLCYGEYDNFKKFFKAIN